MKTSEDIKEPKLADREFDALDQAKPDDDLHSLFLSVQEKAYGAIDWYSKARRSKKRYAQLIRFSAIVLFSAAGLVPILNSVGLLQPEPLVIAVPEGAGPEQLESAVRRSAGQNFNLGQLGYLFAALAAALIGLDKFFGLSSGWARYMMADLSLKKSLARFQMDWVIVNACLDTDDEEAKCPAKRLQLLKSFSIEISTIIEEETKVWAAEFQSALAMLEKSVREAKAARRPGSLQVTVEKGKDITGTVALHVDGELRRANVEWATVISVLDPGPHEIQAVGTNASGEKVTTTELVDVPSGGAANVTLRLE